MKNRFLLGTALFAMVAGASSVWAAGPTFSNKDVKGTYALKFSGFLGSAGNPFPTTSSLPQSGSGIEIADGKGNFNSAILFSIGGSICSGTVTGTYTVNSDGTGTSSGTFTPSATAPSGVPTPNYGCPSQMTGAQDEAFTIVSPGKVEFISTDADSIVSGTAERQSRNGVHH
ncbi:MAG TPA: hypothetical protein VKV03_19860 [Candidatus Binataceae bacterium]|nr:hypothetical protein [Candidatus Binataceae bacterium]